VDPENILSPNQTSQYSEESHVQSFKASLSSGRVNFRKKKCAISSHCPHKKGTQCGDTGTEQVWACNFYVCFFTSTATENSAFEDKFGKHAYIFWTLL